jgi:hypothetical protein
MKKSIKAIALAVLLAAMPVTAFAAGSPSAGNTNYSSNDDSSDDGSSSSTSTSNTGNSTSSNGTITAGTGNTVSTIGSTPGSTTTSDTVTVVTQSGTKVEVQAATTNSSGIMSGFVNTDNGVTVVTGEAATEGLPQTVVDTITAVNNTGDLSGIQGVDTTGKSAYGNTVTVNAAAENLSVSIYVSSLPANGIVQVAFFNKITQTWMMIDAVANPATQIVTFTAPNSGTAVVVG